MNRFGSARLGQRALSRFFRQLKFISLKFRHKVKTCFIILVSNFYWMQSKLMDLPNECEKEPRCFWMNEIIPTHHLQFTELPERIYWKATSYLPNDCESLCSLHPWLARPAKFLNNFTLHLYTEFLTTRYPGNHWLFKS